MRTVKSYNKRLETLRAERSSFMDYWRELSDVHLAHRGRFLTSDRNKGHKRNTKQFNNTSRLSVRTLASGMMAGITSPARPWFRLAAPTPEMNEVPQVKQWLHDVEVKMRRVFNQSNLYNSLHTLYSELGTFGVGSMGVFEDFENVIWCKPYTIGSYMFGMNGKNEVDTMYREYEMMVSQIIDEFGYDVCSREVKQMWDKGNTEAWIKIVHAVEPNDDRDNENPTAKHKAIRSVYYEQSTKDKDSNQFLRESGFDDFPILAPRWDVTGEDIYGTDCPGMTALGDVKALQLMERRQYQAVDKVVNPPMQAPASLRNKVTSASMVAGDITFVDDMAGGGIRSIYDFRPDLGAMQAKISESEHRIKRSFYEDLFLMLSNTDRRQITAREIAERHEEKLLMLGPVLERLHTELLDPLIDRTFNLMQRGGILPPPPEELSGVALTVNYVSVLAQAQRMLSVDGIQQLAAFTGEMAQIWPEARHKFDASQAVDEYSEALGVNPIIVRPDEEVKVILQQEQEAAQAQAQQAQNESMMNMASQAGDIDMDNLQQLSQSQQS